MPRRGCFHVIPQRIFAVLIAFCAIAAACPPASAQQPAPVRVDAVRMDTVQQQRQVTGNVRAVSRSRVAAVEPGLVVELHAVEGTPVRRGDVLAALDNRRLRIELRRMESQIAVLEAVLVEREAVAELRQSDLEMLESLQQRGAGNPKEIADARAESNIAVARRDQAERNLLVTRAEHDLLAQRIDDTTIRAPFDGVIVSRQTELGQWIAEGQAVAEIVSTGAFEVWLDVPQRHVQAVSRADLVVPVHVEALGRVFNATSARVIREVDPLARTFSLVLRIDEEEQLLAPGMSVTAGLPIGTPVEQLTVHKDAVLRNEVGAFVYIVRNAGETEQAVPVKVTVLFELADRAVIHTEELEPGDRAVIEGNERLRPMSPVRVVEIPDDSAIQKSEVGGQRSDVRLPDRVQLLTADR